MRKYAAPTRRYGVEFHRRAFLVRIRIPARGNDNRSGRFLRNRQINVCEPALGACEENLGQIRFEQRQKALCLRISEADIVFQNAGAVFGDHVAAEETANKGKPYLTLMVSIGKGIKLTLVP